MSNNPWGLQNLKPGVHKTINADKLKKFERGYQPKRNKFKAKQKEEAAKRKRAQEEAAKAYEAFVQSFEVCDLSSPFFILPPSLSSRALDSTIMCKWASPVLRHRLCASQVNENATGNPGMTFVEGGTMGAFSYYLCLSVSLSLSSILYVCPVPSLSSKR
eukprot:1367301-Amorphochlora_amoeboformis.AAC.2